MCISQDKNFEMTELFLFLIKGKKPAAKPVIEMGTQQNADIDYDWLPKETTTEFGMFCYNSPGMTTLSSDVRSLIYFQQVFDTPFH